MKNKLTSIISILSLLFVIVSCNDNKEPEPFLQGTWAYKAPYFVFEYSEENIDVNWGGQTLQFKPEELTTMFKSMAGTKMGEYFVGIQFVSESEMNINMKFKDQTQKTLKATYETEGTKLGILLDKESLKEITGKELNIPQLSFDYKIINNQLTAYLNWSYLKGFLNTPYVSGMLDQLFPTLAATLLKDQWQFMPEQAQQAVVNQLKQIFNEVKSKTEDLEIGVVMESVSL